MSEKQEEAKKVVERLLESDEEQLLEQLGMRSKAVEADQSKAADLDPPIALSEVSTMGPKEALRALGERVLRRWNKEAYGLICGNDNDDSQIRNDVKKAFGLGDAAAAGALTTALLAIPGLPVAFAPVIAVILVKKFFGPALDEFCGYWKENLPA